MGRDLAAENIDDWRPADLILLDDIVARRLLRRADVVVKKRPHARKAPDHIHRRDGALEIGAHGIAKIGRFGWRYHDLGGIARKIPISRADQREILFVGNGEDDATVKILENITAVVIEKLLDDDMTALHETNMARLASLRDLADHQIHPGPGGVDDDLRRNLALRARREIAYFDDPTASTRVRR